MMQRYKSIDCMKFMASLCIIAIHTSPFQKSAPLVNFWIMNLFTRWAVPYFALCTGFFIASKNVEKVSLFQVVKKPILKNLRLYVCCVLFYFFYSIPFWINAGIFSRHTIIDYFAGMVINGSFYHLWYLLSLIIALPFLGVCIRHLNNILICVVLIILYTFECLSYSYNIFLPIEFKLCLERMSYYYGFFNGLFRILPFMLCGVLIQRSNALLEKKLCSYLLFAILVFALLGEIAVLYYCGQTQLSYVFMTVPVVCSLFTLSIHSIWCDKLHYKDMGKISVLVYCVHPMIVGIIALFTENAEIRFFLTAIISVGIAKILLKNQVIARLV